MSAITSATAVSIPADDPLIIAIKAEAALAEKRVRETVRNFRKVGELLIELKNRVPHGRFMEEVESLTGIPHRSASRYMGMVNEKPPRRHLDGKNAEAYLRRCLDVRIENKDFQNGQVANLNQPSPRPSPASSKPPLPLGATYQDAEIVEQEAPVIEPEPIDEEPTHEPEALVMDECKPEPGVADWVDGNRKAKTGHKQDHLLDALQILPHLTQDQLKSLVETINTRWLR